MYNNFCQYDEGAKKIKADKSVTVQQRSSKCGVLWRSLEKQTQAKFKDAEFLSTLPNPFLDKTEDPIIESGLADNHATESAPVYGRKALASRTQKGRKVARPSLFDAVRWGSKIKTDQNLHLVEGFMVLVYPHNKGRAVLTGGSPMGKRFMDMFPNNANPTNDFLDFVKGHIALSNVLGCHAPLPTKTRKTIKDTVAPCPDYKGSLEKNIDAVRKQLGYAIYKASGGTWLNGWPGANTLKQMEKTQELVTWLSLGLCHLASLGLDSGTPFGRAHAYPHAQKKWRAHAALERRAGAARLSPHAARHVHAYNRRAGVQSLHACLKGVKSLHALRTGVQALHACRLTVPKNPYKGTEWYPYKGTKRYPYKGTKRYPYKGTKRYPYKGTKRYPYKGTKRYPYKGTKRYPYKGTKRYPYEGTKRYPYKGTVWYPYKGTKRYPYKGTERYPYKGTLMRAPRGSRKPLDLRGLREPGRTGVHGQHACPAGPHAEPAVLTPFAFGGACARPSGVPLSSPGESVPEKGKKKANPKKAKSKKAKPTSTKTKKTDRSTQTHPTTKSGRKPTKRQHQKNVNDEDKMTSSSDTSDSGESWEQSESEDSSSEEDQSADDSNGNLAEYHVPVAKPNKKRQRILAPKLKMLEKLKRRKEDKSSKEHEPVGSNDNDTEADCPVNGNGKGSSRPSKRQCTTATDSSRQSQ
ncbi:hypothetical protein PCASD_17550 [Puccinia coronata f. sp. avenae]|uniref:Uncharacterized protein n=1 Tax=Puccinia coronata f. sp. avenae TaxID=200324 RepID=A0A2N5U3V2_9BASI|nr:hypothetical protein PCASD_17550 [Puccinia coronata f. sp. avenae]